MISLHNMLDADDLENRYLGKAIFYVESENDANFYKQCVAIGHDEYFEFKGLPGRGGYSAAIAKAVEERKANEMVFALVDGEAAADKTGGLSLLLSCSSKVFQVPGEGLEGVIFLSEHELENIIIRLSDVVTFIAHDDALGDVGRKSAGGLKQELEAVIDRQFAGAVCKYASMKMNSENRMNGCFGAVFWDQPERVTLWKLRAAVKERTSDWKAFYVEVKAIEAALRKRFAEGDPGLAAYERLRLTDGKTVMKTMAHNHKVNPKWFGHLTMQIVGNAYFDQLRQEILDIAKKAA